MKKVLFDTSSALALFIHDHPKHKGCSDYFLDNSSNAEFFISVHTVAEMYRNLTSGRRYFTYSPEQAKNLIRRIIPDHFTTVDLDTPDYLLVVDIMEEMALHGATIYDGLIARAAEKAGCSELVTYNIKDFQRVWQITSADLIEP